jgi:hypothetical protein
LTLAITPIAFFRCQPPFRRVARAIAIVDAYPDM